MLCLRNSKKDKMAGTESKREVEGETMAEMAKGHMRRALWSTVRTLGLGGREVTGDLGRVICDPTCILKDSLWPLC